MEPQHHPNILSRLHAPLVAAGVFIAGIIAAWHYSTIDLALSHYDARAHLVVARRVFDSLMPGWQQIGAVWLPLPHVLNMLPVQIDAFYRSGASAIAISIASMTLGAWSLASLVLRTTGSSSAAVAGGVLLIWNPNVLYLQSTPMTEPLLFGTCLLAVNLTAKWIEEGAHDAKAAGWAIVAACMTRYEAWPFTAALLALAFLVLLRRRTPASDAARACAGLAAYPAIAVLLFIFNSRWTTGNWFLTSGFFVAENEALGQPWRAWEQIREGLYLLSGPYTVRMAYIGALAIVITFVVSSTRATFALTLALTAVVALPLYAFVQGHPFRIRYSVALIVAAAAVTASAVALLPRRLRAIVAIAVIAATIAQTVPFDGSAPMVVEARRDAENMRGRAAVTRYVEEHYDDGLVMMSMGSLAHYMHDLSKSGFRIRDFLHEGIGDVWAAAFEYGPHGHVTWIAIEEKAEGGDALFHRARENPRWLRGFERVAEGGGVALYRATSAEENQGPVTK